MKNIEIAKILKVSPATVSLALNDKPGVNPDTKRKILELKNGTFVKDNESDSEMKSSEEKTIGVLIYKERGDIIDETPFFIQLINAIDAHVNASSYKLNIIYHYSSNLIEYVQSVDALGLAGVIIIATEMSPEKIKVLGEQMKTQFVMLDAAFYDYNVDCVLMDNRGGIEQAVNYAYKCGHRNIGFVRSLNQCCNFTDRYMGYVAALMRLNLVFDEKNVFSVGASVEDAKADMEKLINQGIDFPSVLVASNDRIAIGIMEALKEAGYSIPDDISIIGFDNMPQVQYLMPPLTSVQIRHDVIARMAVARIIEKIEHLEAREYSLQQFVKVNLIERESVKMI